MSERKTVNIMTVEGIIDRLDRINRRLIGIIILLIVLLVGTNIVWIVYENQFQDLNIEVEQEAEAGTNNFANDGGLIYNGGV